MIQKYAQDITAPGPVVVRHNLGTADVIVSVYGPPPDRPLVAIASYTLDKNTLLIYPGYVTPEGQFVDIDASGSRIVVTG